MRLRERTLEDERTVLYGYRASDFAGYLGEVPVQRPQSDINVRDSRSFDRRVMAVSLGVHAQGAVLPYPDVYDTPSAVLGARKRLVPEVSPPDPKLLREFRGFVRDWIRQNLTPLPVDSDTTVATWLDGTDYSVARKAQLLSCVEKMHQMGPKYYSCKSFIKRENYTDVKFPRCINSRTDVFKVFSGPIFKLIEKAVFDNPYFIKHIPVHKRAEYIMRMHMPGFVYVATDHSSFEARISTPIMRACEMQLYSYMTQRLPDGKKWLHHVVKALTGEQRCHFKGFDVSVRGARMSGDMCTSLGNGFTNLMVMLFLASRKGPDRKSVV